MTPFLKWAGGKRWLAPAIKDLYEHLNCNKLVEPFVGAGSVFLHVNPTHFVGNDTNQHLINLYREIQAGDFSINIDIENTKENFLRHRSLMNKLSTSNCPDDKRYCAEAFYFINRTCFNGLSRFSKKTGFNVGWGKYKKPKIQIEFLDYGQAIKGYEFTNGDFRDVHDKITPTTMLFADPPYYGDGVFRGYSENNFTLEDQSDLAALLDTAEKAPVIATNSLLPEITDLYTSHGFDVFKIMAPRRISSDGNRDVKPEMIAIKNICPKLFRKILKKRGHSLRVVKPRK